jgi:ribosomal protein S18 acetylase RimI-like enzyme
MTIHGEPPRGATAIRRARPADTDAIVAVVASAYALYTPRIGRQPAPVNADYRSLVLAAEAWVAVDAADRPVGVLVMRPARDSLFVENVAVDPAHQRRGIGRLLLSFAEHHARQLGLPAITLYTNVRMTENLRYYPSLGYVETGRRQQEGFDRVFFRKSLSLFRQTAPACPAPCPANRWDVAGQAPCRKHSPGTSLAQGKGGPDGWRPPRFAAKAGQGSGPSSSVRVMLAPEPVCGEPRVAERLAPLQSCQVATVVPGNCPLRLADQRIVVPPGDFRRPGDAYRGASPKSRHHSTWSQCGWVAKPTRGASPVTGVRPRGPGVRRP